LKIGPRTALLL